MTEDLLVRPLSMRATVPTVRPALTRHHAAVIRGTGGAIVSLERPHGAKPLVVGVERFAMRIEPVVAALREHRAKDRACRVVVDADGLGDAAWALLGKPQRRHGWTLYGGRGVVRAELTRTLLVAVARALAQRVRCPAQGAEAPALVNHGATATRQGLDGGTVTRL